MNGALLAERSAVVVMQRYRFGGPYVLRCFECDWGVTMDGTWADVLNVGHEHERGHGKGPRRVAEDGEKP